MNLHHILSAQQFTDRKFLEELFARTDELMAQERAGAVPQSLAGKIIATLFFEPSTRTRLSFEAAALKLGAGVISTENAREALSAKKGETLQDTIRIVNGYASAIILRHHETGGAALAAEVSKVPIVNAGDGSGEHPTQALGDVYTIEKELGCLSRGLKIAMVGDLRYGRTVHSLSRLLGLYQDVEIYLVSPPSLQMPAEYKKDSFKEFESIAEILPEVDVLYVTRVQKERFASLQEYQKLKGSYLIDEETLRKMKKNAILMHPLPRVDEIDRSVDSDPRAAYFRQAKNGLYVRMALLQEILK